MTGYQKQVRRSPPVKYPTENEPKQVAISPLAPFPTSPHTILSLRQLVTALGSHNLPHSLSALYCCVRQAEHALFTSSIGQQECLYIMTRERISCPLAYLLHGRTLYSVGRGFGVVSVERESKSCHGGGTTRYGRSVGPPRTTVVQLAY